jgi:hypothetical protein
MTTSKRGGVVGREVCAFALEKCVSQGFLPSETNTEKNMKRSENQNLSDHRQ